MNQAEMGGRHSMCQGMVFETQRPVYGIVRTPAGTRAGGRTGVMGDEMKTRLRPREWRV